jgi:AmmeMemoRadiSam system protein A
MPNKGAICAGFLLPHPPVLVPEVGRGKERTASSTLSAFNLVANDMELLKPDTVVVISPHAPLYSDYIFMYDAPTLEGGFEQFGVPQLKLGFEQDSELRQEIECLMHKNDLSGGALTAAEMCRHKVSSTLDHGALVPLYYLGLRYKAFRLVVMSCSAYDLQRLYKLGGIIRNSAENVGRRLLIVASGDMSHKVNKESPYGEDPSGVKFDSLITDALSDGDISRLLSINGSLRDKAAECGYRSLVILCGAFDGIKTKIKLLSYEAPFGIGYCVASFMPTDETAVSAFDQALKKTGVKHDESPQVKIARETLENYVRQKKKPSAADFKVQYDNESIFTERAGVFVSLKKFGELRGCIGTTSPTTDCIADEIIQNAISAGTCDSRFEPVEALELDYLDYSVDVLTSAQKILSKDELDPKRYGVIVRHAGHSGLLLPDLDGVDTIDQQLKIACSKAGIDLEKEYEIYKFEVIRYK